MEVVKLRIKANHKTVEFYEDGNLILKIATSFFYILINDIEKKDKFDSTYDLIKRKNNEKKT